MIDEHAATELKLFIDTDGDLYRRQTASILKNLATKKARGEYNRDLAVKLFGYLVTEGVKKYVKEHGSPDRPFQPWHRMFDVPTRRRVAEELVNGFEAEFALGNYDRLLPKKYQPQSKQPVHHARKPLARAASSKWKVPDGLKVVWAPVNQAYFALWPADAPTKQQQVLKVLSADAMHDWLRETYGDAYGLANQAARRHHSTISVREIREFGDYIGDATNRQIQGVKASKPPSQLDREIARALAAGRRGR